MSNVLGCSPFWPVVVLLLLAGCASIQAPDGGPKDATGPLLIDVSPPNESTQFVQKKLTFTFDEYLKTTDLSSKIFVSPLLAKAPEAWAQNKKIHIRLPDSLIDDQTYVITLYEGVVDDHEGNPPPTPIRYAFSTGSYLDSASVSGQVIDAVSGMAAKGWLVLLFDSDSIAGDNFYNRPPVYATVSDEGGNFDLSYLKAGRYRMLGLKDTDRNYKLSSVGEGIALADSDLVVLDSVITGRLLRSFMPDTSPPILKEIYRPTPFSLLLEFTETIESGLVVESGTEKQILRQHINGKTQQLLMAWPDSSTRDSFDLTLRAVRDSVGNRIDSTYRLKWPVAMADSTFEIQRLDTVKTYLKRSWMSTAPLDSAGLAAGLRVQTADSVPVRFSLLFEPPFRFSIMLFTLPDSVEQVFVVSDSAWRSPQGLLLKSPMNESWELKERVRLASISGRLASDTLMPVLIELRSPDGKQIWRSTGREFFFQELMPADYKLRVLFDADSNQRWTPGRLMPKRQPEDWYRFPETITLRAGWDVENVIINYPPKKTAADSLKNSSSTKLKSDSTQTKDQKKVKVKTTEPEKIKDNKEEKEESRPEEQPKNRPDREIKDKRRR